MRSLSAVCGALMLLVLGALVQADLKSPTVNVYTQTPLELGQKNTLICHCSSFHPPRIDMQLLRNGQEVEGCQESDLSFKHDWTYYKSKSVDIVPKDGDKYECEVRHDEGEAKTYSLEIF